MHKHQANMAYNPVKRVIVCVDGTWYDPNGLVVRREGNNSNIYRIYTSVKEGTFVQDNRAIKQVAYYESGVGFDRQPLDPFNDSITTTQEAFDNQVNRIFAVRADILHPNKKKQLSSCFANIRDLVLLSTAQRVY